MTSLKVHERRQKPNGSQLGWPAGACCCPGAMTIDICDRETLIIRNDRSEQGHLCRDENTIVTVAGPGAYTAGGTRCCAGHYAVIDNGTIPELWYKKTLLQRDGFTVDTSQFFSFNETLWARFAESMDLFFFEGRQTFEENRTAATQVCAGRHVLSVGGEYVRILFEGAYTWQGFFTYQSVAFSADVFSLIQTTDRGYLLFHKGNLLWETPSYSSHFEYYNLLLVQPTPETAVIFDKDTGEILWQVECQNRYSSGKYLVIFTTTGTAMIFFDGVLTWEGALPPSGYSVTGNYFRSYSPSGELVIFWEGLEKLRKSSCQSYTVGSEDAVVRVSSSSINGSNHYRFENLCRGEIVFQGESRTSSTTTSNYFRGKYGVSSRRDYYGGTSLQDRGELVYDKQVVAGSQFSGYAPTVAGGGDYYAIRAAFYYIDEETGEEYTKTESRLYFQGRMIWRSDDAFATGSEFLDDAFYFRVSSTLLQVYKNDDAVWTGNYSTIYTGIYNGLYVVSDRTARIATVFRAGNPLWSGPGYSLVNSSSYLILHDGALGGAAFFGQELIWMGDTYQSYTSSGSYFVIRKSGGTADIFYLGTPVYSGIFVSATARGDQLVVTVQSGAYAVVGKTGQKWEETFSGTVNWYAAGNYVCATSANSDNANTRDTYFFFNGQLVKVFYGEATNLSTSYFGCADQLRISPPNERSFVRVYVDGEMTQEIEGAVVADCVFEATNSYPLGPGEPDMLGKPRSSSYKLISDSVGERLLLWYEDFFKEEIASRPYRGNISGTRASQNNYLVLGGGDYANDLGWCQAWYFGQKVFYQEGDWNSFYELPVNTVIPYFDARVLAGTDKDTGDWNVVFLIDGAPAHTLIGVRSNGVSGGPVFRDGAGSFEFGYYMQDSTGAWKLAKCSFRYGVGLVYEGLLSYTDGATQTYYETPTLHGYNYERRCAGVDWEWDESLGGHWYITRYYYEITYDGTTLLSWASDDDVRYTILNATTGDARPDFDVLKVRRSQNGEVATLVFLNGSNLGILISDAGSRYIVTDEGTYWNGNSIENALVRDGGQGYSNDTAVVSANSALFVQGEKIAEGTTNIAYRTFHLAKHSVTKYSDGNAEIFFGTERIGTRHWPNLFDNASMGASVIIGVGFAVIFPNGNEATGEDRIVAAVIGNQIVWEGKFVDSVYAPGGGSFDENGGLHKRVYIQDTEGTVLVVDVAGLMRFNSRFQRLSVR